jgi:hypothetical protein
MDCDMSVGPYSNVVNPDEISSGEGESIPTPDIFVVQVTDLYVLDNDILAGKGESLSLDYAFGSDAQDSLVGANLDGVFRSLVVSGGLLDLTCTTSVQQDALALCSSSPACACLHQYNGSRDQGFGRTSISGYCAL